MIKSADKEINSISKRIDELTIKNNASLDSINVIKNNNIELEKEVGELQNHTQGSFVLLYLQINALLCLVMHVELFDQV